MNRYLAQGLLSICFFLLGFKAIAQDIHHSQFYTSPINVNPALTGVFNGDVRAALNYRNQWFVNDLVKYMTFTGSVDKRFYPKKWTTKGMFSGGLLMNYDQAGDSKLSLAYVGISVSYAYPITPRNIISAGVLLGGSNRRFLTENLTWDEQYNGSQYVPGSPSGETFDKTNHNFFDVATGLNYRWQKSKRTKIDFGAGLFHLNKPEQKFFDQSASSKLPLRLNINLTPNFQLTKRLDLLLHGQFQQQSVYNETVVGLYGKIYAGTKRGKELALLLGLATRFERDFIPKIALEYNQWYAGFSYDVNTSPWKKATNGRGGPEFSLIYIFTKARPLAEAKACPIL